MYWKARKRHLFIHIKLCGGPAKAIVVPEVEGNWISSEILDRMKSQPKRQSHSDIREAAFNKSFKSIGEYIELSCHRDKSRQPCYHRFYITKNIVKFDVLLGRDGDAGSNSQAYK